jgi:hypothetical protein
VETPEQPNSDETVLAGGGAGGPGGAAGDPGATRLSPPGVGEFAVSASFAGFVIEGIAGRGGMGVVYRARQLRPPRTVALKVVAPELANDPAFRERFLHESEIAAAIEHPNVVPVYEVGEQDGSLYIAMRHVEGSDLRATIAREGKLGPGRAASIVAQVAAALDAAHARGLVHRDVKPANVLLAHDGEDEHAYLTDFGLAKQLAARGATKTGMFAGTADYAAPEQIEGRQVDARTDVYAAGGLLYHALTGEVPYPADSDVAKMWAHVKSDPPVPSAVDPALPPGLDAVVERAMAKRPEDRYPSAGDLGRAALAAAQGRAPQDTERSVARGEAAGAPPLRGPAAGAPPLRGAPPDATAPTGRLAAGGGGRSRSVFGGALVVAAAAAAVVAVLLIGSGGHAKTSSNASASTATPSAAQSVQACITAHALSHPSEQRAPQAGETNIQQSGSGPFTQTTYATCTSPPAPGADPDGYRAITVTQAAGPGSDEASGEDEADRIESPCGTLSLVYGFASQGVITHYPPLLARPGEIWIYRATGGSNSVPFTEVPTSQPIQLPFNPVANEVDVLHNGSLSLNDASCAS